MSLKKIFKILTLLSILSFIDSANASILTQQQSDNYLRWNVFVAKDVLILKKEGAKVTIRTLSRDVFDKLKTYFNQYKARKKYISSIIVREIDQNNNVATIEIKLIAEDVELFHFYRQKDNKLVMDFWRDNDLISEKNAAIKKIQPKKKKVQIEKIQKASIKKVKTAKIKSADTYILKKKESEYRDYRYGASFIWDYSPISPKIKKVINLSSKTPEFLYPIKDREYQKSDKEAHIQTTINMYRAKKWGRMYQSLQLYVQSYGDEDNVDFNEYIKANALLRINFQKPDRTTVKQAINIFENIANRTKNYELKRGILKYLMSYYIDSQEHVKSYQLAKTYYVETKERFDIEETEYAAEVILYNLAQMNQTSVINQLLKEQTIRKLIPTQLIYAYKIFTLVQLNKIKEAVRFYEKVKGELKAPVHPSIVFNIGECYFRMAKFEKAIKAFDQFVTKYSYMTSSERARTRLALSYEILEKNVEQTIELYRNAINRGQSEKISYEAKIRYVALTSVRKRKIAYEDIEKRVFLEQERNKGKKRDRNLLKLLWLTRLRTFIVDGKFSEALSYLNAVPLNTLKPSERRVFEGDGAEIVYGILRENYLNENYSKVIQAWEIYKNKYVDKVASDPFLNYLVGRSYIKLGLYKGFDRQINRFEKIKSAPLRTFPIWNKREIERTPESLMVELRIAKDVRLGNWDHVKRLVDRLEVIAPKMNKISFYKGLIADNDKKYLDIIKHYEIFLSKSGTSDLYDPYEISMMMQSYTNALYELGKVNQFKKVASALLADTDKISLKNKYMFKVKERVSYLLIEITSGNANSEAYLELEPMIIKFKKEFESSIYSGRVNYLLGVAMIANKKNKEGVKILNELLNDTKVPDYIKEMARSELSLLEIKNRII